VLLLLLICLCHGHSWVPLDIVIILHGRLLPTLLLPRLFLPCLLYSCRSWLICCSWCHQE
jgi:hypothetical protein